MSSFDPKGANLIFLISLPRAGSTMLQRVLEGNREVFSLPEPWIMLHPAFALKNEGIMTEYAAQFAKDALDTFLSKLKRGEEEYIEAIRAFGNHLYSAALEGTGKKYFLDKTPRYFHIIPELVRIYPDAHYIILLRNPLAVLSSVLKTWFNNNLENLQNSPNMVDVMKGPGAIVDGMDLLGDKAIVVRYEEFVTKPESGIRELCNRIGLDYSESMLHYDNRAVAEGEFGDPTGVQSRSTPDAESLNKYLQNLGQKKLVHAAHQYLNTLGPEIFKRMGYDFEEMSRALQDAAVTS